jgi:hypothetical protein
MMEMRGVQMHAMVPMIRALLFHIAGLFVRGPKLVNNVIEDKHCIQRVQQVNRAS